jgi:hypothetical protein
MAFHAVIAKNWRYLLKEGEYFPDTSCFTLESMLRERNDLFRKREPVFPEEGPTPVKTGVPRGTSPVIANQSLCFSVNSPLGRLAQTRERSCAF